MPTYTLIESVVAFASKKHHISVCLFDEERRKRIAGIFQGLSRGVNCVRLDEKDEPLRRPEGGLRAMVW